MTHHGPGITWRRRVLVILAAMAVLCGQPAPAPAQDRRDDYLSTPGAASNAIARLVKEIGHTPAVSRITIEPHKITLLVQGRRLPHDVDAWTVTRQRILLIDRESVSGPTPSRTDTIVAEAEGGFFPLRDVALADVTTVIANAIRRVALEETGQVERVIIDRRIAILPKPAYDEVRWTIPVTSGRESATAFADAGGRIVGLDLSQTNRARRLDLLAQDDWPMAQARDDLLAIIGPGAVVHEVRVYNTYLFVVADHPTTPGMRRDYSWNLSGVKRGIVDMPRIDAQMRGTAPFSLSALDYTKLPQIKAAARTALGMQDSKVTFIKAEKPTTGARQADVRWAVEIGADRSQRGVAMISTSGQVLDAILPPSRRPVEPWLAPATIQKTLARIGAEFGPKARFHEISINHSSARIMVEDPQAPGTMVSLMMNVETIRREGPPIMPWDKRPEPTRVFTLDELAPLTTERLAEFIPRALRRLKLDGGAVVRYTIARGDNQMIARSPRGIPVVEVRAEKDGRQGRVVFDILGAEIDVVMP